MKATFSVNPSPFANCPDSLLRNKAKNALSLARPFSLGFAGQKYEEIGLRKGKRKKFMEKFVDN